VKHILAITVFLALLAQTFSKDLIVAHFYLNQSYITSHFCENKDKPQMHCNGQCHLKKTLQKEARQEKNIFQNDKHDIVLFFGHEDIAPAISPTYFIRPEYFTYNDKRKVNFPAAVFHPPTLFV
jgi:hypothetical protein